MKFRKALAAVGILTTGLLYLHLGFFHAGLDFRAASHAAGAGIHAPSHGPDHAHDAPASGDARHHSDEIHGHGSGAFLPREPAPAIAPAFFQIAPPKAPNLAPRERVFTGLVSSAPLRSPPPLLFLIHLAFLI